ncbi:hypothetical protein V1478_001161 [Vespula squamosa]|uniref:Uncharacterized protein n=1 Tax=Vespula squamosa TaxID=30214 RepID=A0ABD2C7K8_VESSQ
MACNRTIMEKNCTRCAIPTITMNNGTRECEEEKDDEEEEEEEEEKEKEKKIEGVVLRIRVARALDKERLSRSLIARPELTHV